MKKKILYICNVGMEGQFLQGVINKIKGQEVAFKNEGFEIDILYPGENGTLIIKKSNGEKFLFKGERKIDISAPKYQKLIQHFRVAFLGSINFAYCFPFILNEKYCVIYLRFYLPGRNLVSFLKKIKKSCPGILILLEYPTLSVNELFKNDLVRRIAYKVNYGRIKQLNAFADYIITLTKDKILFKKPSIHMPNGIDLSNIMAVPIVPFDQELNILGVASDVLIVHGFDKIIRGIATYVNKRGSIKICFRVISNPRNRVLEQLKSMANDLGIEDFIKFELPKTRDELIDVYKYTHVCIGSLAPHRIGLMNNYPLKHREYAAFGLPFIMSKGDDQFEGSPFVMSIERNDEPLDIQQVVDFYRTLRKNHPNYPQEFRSSVEEKITWGVQMKSIFEVINKIQTS